MARADFARSDRDDAAGRPARDPGPMRDRNGTGGVPPIPPLGAVSMFSWQRVTAAYDGEADGTEATETPTAQRTAVATAIRASGEPSAGAKGRVQTGEQDNARTIPPLPRAKPAPTNTASPSAAAKKPIIIAAKSKRGQLAHGSASGIARGDDERVAGGMGGWPRSKAGRVVALVSLVATLFTALAVATPLGGPGLGVAFQAYGNAMPWSAPTATTAPSAPANPPVTSSANPDKQAIIDDIQAVFGQYAPGALNVARCESGYDPNARNTTPVGNSHAEGVFQILYPSTWNGTSYHAYSPYNSWANIRAAYEIFKRDGYSWREWQCRP